MGERPYPRIDPTQIHIARRGLGRADQCLGRNAVSEHACSAETVAFDDGDLGSELRGNECSLVATRSTTDDDNARHVMILAHSVSRFLSCPSTRRTPATWTPNAWRSGVRIRRRADRLGCKVGG